MSDVVDLFAGPGGWDIAAEALGLDVVGLETDDAACQTRRAAGLCTVKADVAAADPLDYLGVTGLIASPPCQAWSRAGKRLGLVDQEHVFAATQALAMGIDLRERLLPRLRDPRSLLAIEPLRWALALQPRWIALEQVPDVLPLWQMIAGALGARGYSTWTGKLNSADYGVPQTRERAFMIASCERRVDRPPPTHADPRPGLPLHALPWVSMAQALGWDSDDRVGFPRRADTPSNKAGRGRVDIGGTEYRERDLRDGDQPAQALTEKTRSWIVLRNGNQPRAAERTLDEPAPTMAFGNNAARVRFEVRTGQRSSKRQLEDGVYSDVESQEYVRDGDRPAPTVDSKPSRWKVDRVPSGLNTGRGWAKGGSRADAQVRAVDRPAPAIDAKSGGRDQWVVDRPATTVSGDPRIAQPGHKKDEQNPDCPGRMEDAIRVSLEEAAILQSFPADYPWQGNRTKAYQQIGNAVPPLLALHVLQAVAS